MNKLTRKWSVKDEAEKGGKILLSLGLLFLLICAILIANNYDFLWLAGFSIGVISVGLGFTAIGMAEKAERYTKLMLEHINGTILEAISAELDLARSPQSKSYQLTSTKENVLYDSSKYKNPHPILFGNAWIRLDTMRERDIIRIRQYIKEDGKWFQASPDKENTYSGSQSSMAKITGGFYNKEGVKITAEQLSMHSQPIEIGCYVYDAARGT